MTKFTINNSSGVPLYRQIIDQIKYGMSTGELSYGTQLPTVRQLAVKLSINPNTVIKAYKELEILGILESQQGSGTFISEKKVEITDVERNSKILDICKSTYQNAVSYGIDIKEIIKVLKDMDKQTSLPQRRRGTEEK